MSEKNKNLTKDDSAENQGLSVFGIKIYNSDEAQKVDSPFGAPTSEEIQFGIQTTTSEETNPALQSMINQLELAVRANKFDEETVGLYQQINRFLTNDKISQLSQILNPTALNIIRDKALNLGREQQNPQNNPQIDVKQNAPQPYAILSDEEIKKMQSEFLEHRNDYKKNIETAHEIAPNSLEKSQTNL